VSKNSHKISRIFWGSAFCFEWQNIDNSGLILNVFQTNFIITFALESGDDS